MPLPYALRHPLLALAEPTYAVLERLGHARHKLDARKAAGATGERLAYFHLRRAGYLVVARQWRAPNPDGEVDLIAWQGETLCFIEVKTRAGDDRFAPSYAIDAHKRKALRRMAAAYVQSLPWAANQPANPTIRFDAVSVLLGGKPHRITLQPGIFPVTEPLQ